MTYNMLMGTLHPTDSLIHYRSTFARCFKPSRQPQGHGSSCWNNVHK